ncbi:MAG: daunorubicin resistance protein DrrA family ABC transporter ATP-binding protein [Candidatus Velthaea sp.]
MIVIDHLRKTFPEQASLISRIKRRSAIPRRLILDDVCLQVASGELVGLLGGNGAGKTTLLQILSTLSRGDAGTVTIGGIRIDTDPARVRRSIGFCGSADRGFYYRLTARENLRFFGVVSNQLAAHEREDRIETVLELVDLREHGDRLYAHLSTGMRQRLSVARALLGDPPVLLFDEPTRAVDPIHAEALRTLIRTTLVERLGKTVVLATNLLDEAWAICHRVAVLRAGRVVAFDAPCNLDSLRGVTTRYRIVVDRVDDDVLARTRSVPGFIGLALSEDANAYRLDVEIQQVAFSLTALLQAVSAGGIDVLSVQPQHATPADVFADLVTER